MVGSEHQKQEEVIKVAMGSMYQGEALFLRSEYETHETFSRFRYRACS